MRNFLHHRSSISTSFNRCRLPIAAAPVIAELLEGRRLLSSTPTQMFSDDFNAGPSPLWGNERGSWAASGGSYAATAPNADPLTFSSLPFNLTDFTVDADILGVDDGGIWLRADAAGDAGVLLVTGGNGGTGTGLYWHVIQGTTSGAGLPPLNEQDGLFSQGDDIHIHIIVTGDTYAAYLNGSLTPATSLTTDAFSSGRVALYDNGSQSYNNVTVAAALTPGSFDPTFNGGSPVSLGFAAQASAVTASGQTLLAGEEPGASAGSIQAVLERLNADGSIDSTFGSGGTITDAATGDEAFYGVVTEPDGTIVSAGASNGDLLLAGYNADGAVDTSFGTGGRVTVPIAGAADATAYGITTDADGNLVVVGSAGGQFLADRFTEAGAQDPGFNNGAPLLFGSASDSDVLGNVAVESAANGSGIVAAGASAGSVVVVQLTPEGTLDDSFGTGGIVTLPELAAPDLNPGQSNQTEGLALDPAGNIVVANTTSGGGFATARLTGAGAPDSTFGSGGIVTTGFGSGTADADFVGVEPDGSQILVAGTYTLNGSVQRAIAAYTPQGDLDTTFGTGGMELLSTGLSAAPALTEPSGKITPQALGLGGAYIEEIFGNLNSGKLLLGIGQPGRSTATAAIQRLIAPAPIPTPTPTPTPTPLPSGTLQVSVSASLPTAVLGGAKIKSSATVTVSNPTDRLVSGPATVKLLVSTAQSLDGATQLVHVTEKLKLKARARESLRVKLSSFPSLPQGNYYLIATVTAPDGTTTGAAGPSLAIAPPFVTIKTSNVTGSPATIAPGKKLNLSLTLQNNSNTQAPGTAALMVSLSTSSTGAGGSTVATTPLRVKLKAGKSGVYRVRLIVPAGTAAGSYYLATSLAVGAVGGTVAADGIAVSGMPITVT